MMADDFVWEPASVEEAAYYDKLFKVGDRDKNKALDGQETVKFLSFSGLTKAQLKVYRSIDRTPYQVSYDIPLFPATGNKNMLRASTVRVVVPQTNSIVAGASEFQLCSVQGTIIFYIECMVWKSVGSDDKAQCRSPRTLAWTFEETGRMEGPHRSRK